MDFFSGQNIGITVVDLFTIKPVDKATVLKCATATGGKLITVEDHYPEGGIGSAVAEAISDVTGRGNVKFYLLPPIYQFDVTIFRPEL